MKFTCDEKVSVPLLFSNVNIISCSDVFQNQYEKEAAFPPLGL